MRQYEFETPSLSDKAQKQASSNSRNLAVTLLPVTLPAVIFYAYLGRICKETEMKQEVHVEYVETAREILEDDPTSESTEIERETSDILHHYGEIFLTSPRGLTTTR